MNVTLGNIAVFYPSLAKKLLRERPDLSELSVIRESDVNDLSTYEMGDRKHFQFVERQLEAREQERIGLGAFAVLTLGTAFYAVAALLA